MDSEAPDQLVHPRSRVRSDPFTEPLNAVEYIKQQRRPLSDTVVVQAIGAFTIRIVCNNLVLSR